MVRPHEGQLINSVLLTRHSRGLKYAQSQRANGQSGGGDDLYAVGMAVEQQSAGNQRQPLLRGQKDRCRHTPAASPRGCHTLTQHSVARRLKLAHGVGMR